MKPAVPLLTLAWSLAPEDAAPRVHVLGRDLVQGTDYTLAGNVLTLAPHIVKEMRKRRRKPSAPAT
jgi:hypothetical protein